MRHRVLITAALAGVLLLAGCGSAPKPLAAGSDTPAPAAIATTPTPTTTPVVPPSLVVTTDGMELVSGEQTRSASFDDGADVVALLAAAANIAAPAGESKPDIFATAYSFEGATVYVPQQGTAWIIIESAKINGVPLRTRDGISVGSTRSQLKALGAEDVYDENNDGVADDLAMDFVDEPGTESLAHPGSVGRNYIEALLRGDVVNELLVPANDYSDI